MSESFACESLHHVSIPVTDLERSRCFYRDVLGLPEIPRPPFDFPGAWFTLGPGGQQLHLIVYSGQTFRKPNSIETHDGHYALRVPSFRRAVEHFLRLGYREDSADPATLLIVRPHATAGFPQIYLLDPDRHVIEINAAALD